MSAHLAPDILASHLLVASGSHMEPFLSPGSCLCVHYLTLGLQISTPQINLPYHQSRVVSGVTVSFLFSFPSSYLLRSLRIFSAAARSLQSCPTLCDPIDSSPSGSPAPGILQARTLEWVAIPSPMHESEVAQSCPTLSDPTDCSPPGSSFHGIFQARVPEWGAIAFSEYAV